MNEKKEQLKKEIEEAISVVTEMSVLNELKVVYFGKKGKITELSNALKEMSIEKKKEFGKVLNELKEDAMSLLEEKKKQIEEKMLNEKLERERIDITLPSKKIKRGSKHPMTRMVEQFEDLFVSMGYTVYEGT